MPVSTPKRPALPALLILAGLFVASRLLGCGGSGGTATGNDHDGGNLTDGSIVGDGGFVGDANLSPDVFGSGPGMGLCLQLGASCHTDADCCSSDCVNGSCEYPACHSDNTACTTSGQCCSQDCVSGKCKPLNTSCSTLGNACTDNGACCSGLCTSETCQP